MRQMRVQVEGCHVPKQAKVVKGMIDLDSRRRPIRCRRRPQTEAIIDGYAKRSQQCPRQATETLPRRDAMIAMMHMFDDLAFDAGRSHRIRSLPDVVMGTNEDQVIGVIEETPDRLDFRRSCRLIGAQRVEADDHDAIDAIDHRVERRHCAIIGDAFDLIDVVSRKRFCLFGECLKVGFLDMVQESGDALINVTLSRQFLEFRIKEPA